MYYSKIETDLPRFFDNCSKPSNALPKPIEELIKRLQALPPGTTHEEVEGEFHGGQCVTPDGNVLGTGYQLRINVVEGVV